MPEESKVWNVAERTICKLLRPHITMTLFVKPSREKRLCNPMQRKCFGMTFAGKNRYGRFRTVCRMFQNLTLFRGRGKKEKTAGIASSDGLKNLLHSMQLVWRREHGMKLNIPTKMGEKCVCYKAVRLVLLVGLDGLKVNKKRKSGKAPKKHKKAFLNVISTF